MNAEGIPGSWAAAIMVLALIQTPYAPQRAPTLPPVDEATHDATFVAFRDNLLRIVGRRDRMALVDLVDPGIMNTFGGDNGIDAFRRLWRLDAGDSPLWEVLEGVLSHGGTFDTPDSFVAPYVFSRWPDEFDGFDHVALVGDRVRIRALPAADASVLAILSRAILRRQEAPYNPDWTGVVLPDGRPGFVASALARSPIDYRAYFTRSNGRWRMVVLIGGD